MKYIGLDISTTCIGYSFLDECGKIMVCNALQIPTSKYDGLTAKMNEFVNHIGRNIDSTDIVFAEKYLLGFSKGFSNAHTITQLIYFQGMIQGYLLTQYQIDVILIAASHARKLVGCPGKRIGNVSVKELAHNILKKKYGDLVPLWYNRNNNVQPATYDASDSLIIALAGYTEWSIHKHKKS